MGVDVFFVISGYLITTILIEDIDNKRSASLDFTNGGGEADIAGVVPCHVLLRAACLGVDAGNPNEGLFQGLVAACLFASNMLFWRRTGYFDVGEKENPLLHTWSLAIEERYYLRSLVPGVAFRQTRVFWTLWYSRRRA